VSTVTETLEARGLVLDRLGERPRLARVRHLGAFRDGDWPAARAAAEEKSADPAA
jgi:hypothetical protein